MNLYQPLQSSDASREFRLATIRHGSSGAQIQCTLKVAPIGDTIAYSALSYCCGDPTLLHKIICNDETLVIAENLHGALQRIRQEGEDVVLWADAICINQFDGEEKAQQIGLMNEIYTHATKVLVHLGDFPDVPEEDLDAAMALINRQDNTEKKALTDEGEEPREENGKKKLQAPADAPENRTDLLALAALFAHPWFNRTWTVQEVVLAKQASVLIRHLIIPWDRLLDAARLLWWVGQQVDPLALAHCELMQARQTMRESRSADNEEQKPKELAHLLNQFRFAAATDPRDKLYGLLGIMPRKDAYISQVDYTLPVVEVYCDFFRSWIKTDQTLEALSFVLNSYGESDTASALSIAEAEEAPSWMPDWSMRSQCRQLGLRKNFGTPLQQRGLHPGRVEMYGRTMILASGFYVDKVQFVEQDIVQSIGVSHSRGDHNLSDHTHHIIKRWYHAMRKRNDLQTTGWTPLEAFAMLLVTESDQNWIPDVYRWKDLFPWWPDEPMRYGPPASETITLSLGSSLPKAILSACSGQRLFFTTSGLMGTASKGVKPGDWVCVLAGTRVPVILMQEDITVTATFEETGREE